MIQFILFHIDIEKKIWVVIFGGGGWEDLFFFFLFAGGGGVRGRGGTSVFCFRNKHLVVFNIKIFLSSRFMCLEE